MDMAWAQCRERSSWKAAFAAGPTIQLAPAPAMLSPFAVVGAPLALQSSPSMVLSAPSPPLLASPLALAAPALALPAPVAAVAAPVAALPVLSALTVMPAPSIGDAFDGAFAERRKEEAERLPKNEELFEVTAQVVAAAVKAGSLPPDAVSPAFKARAAKIDFDVSSLSDAVLTLAESAEGTPWEARTAALLALL